MSSLTEFDPEELPTFKRKVLQALCKERELRANGKNKDMVAALEQWYVDTHLEASVVGTPMKLGPADESDVETEDNDGYESYDDEEMNDDNRRSRSPSVADTVAASMAVVSGKIGDLVYRLWKNESYSGKKYSYRSPIADSRFTSGGTTPLRSTKMAVSPAMPVTPTTPATATPHSRSSDMAMCFRGLLALAAIAAVAFVVVDPTFFAPKVVYCDKGPSIDSAHAPSPPGCVPCPSGATCLGGAATCSGQFRMLRDGKCVEVPELVRAKAYVATTGVKLIATRAGEFFCGGVASRAWEEEELKDAIRASAPSSVLPLLDAAWPTFLYDTARQFTSTTYTNTSGIYVAMMNQVDNGVPSDVAAHPGKVLFFAAPGSAQYSLVCSAKAYLLETLRTYLYEVSGALILVALIMWWRMKAKAAAMDNADAAALYNTVLRTLFDFNGSVPRSHIKHTLLSPEQLSDSRWERIWGLAVHKVLSNPSVREAPRKIRGETEMMWEWMSDLPPHGYIESPVTVDRRHLNFESDSPTSTPTVHPPASPPAFDSPHVKVGSARRTSAGSARRRSYAYRS
ncbi:uncharacterized protein AMSG_02829 [Thecamonas trahens ATCC 50062]|uniref:Man1/Src1-like C-terminal domain-containing protein n=1 Tax=Thecamonas trahens ATCC 50062 TaxID=461836 RepID=A0A0L0D268_THETB|nr:hypothetical protein AMSG_02829 [Thecamonas trahens ATCC 50062]KNC46377.1 hypothetical protein AMSG_02829 [Thecamonas trahens ATCC 50062]|eukprot:XP_013760670.1 hypothetical protein AMSG_02829 [Thecamonas trahens ATCC 50062]